MLVGPWLDHPWLFAVITGLAVILGNECSFSTIRLPAILMSSFCAGLIYLIGRKLYNQRIGILASLFFSFVPSIVIFNRQALAENGIIFFTLISFYLILKYFDNYRKKWLYFAAISSGLASLCKVSGIVSILFIISILFYKKRYHDAFISFITGSLLFMIYPLTGIIYNWSVFYRIILEHSKRTMVLSNWLNLTVAGFIDQILKRIFLTTGFIFDVYIIDWWIIFSWISILYLNKNFDKQNQFILLGIISNLAILLILIGTEYGWYMIPFYPFFCFANAYFINEFIKEPDLIKACIFIFTVYLLSFLGI
ncbi:MAG: glycosyltransferase family 39 protein [Candidatus Micrarchaeia archaeon]